jgi:hypothetical protein
MFRNGGWFVIAFAIVAAIVGAAHLLFPKTQTVTVTSVKREFIPLPEDPNIRDLNFIFRNQLSVYAAPDGLGLYCQLFNSEDSLDEDEPVWKLVYCR